MSENAIPGSPPKHCVEAIEKFFDRERPVGLHLPSGWFGGRPMDGYHELTFTLRRPGRLIVELDSRLLLIFTGDRTTVTESTTDLLATSEARALSVAEFEHCIVDIRSYGADRADYETFRTGAVSFVSAS